MLPENFAERMQQMLGEEYEAFSACYEQDKWQALRVNTLKSDTEMFVQHAPFALHQVPWEKNGFYYNKEDSPGKHPYHEAGVYYIQEPSAMAPVTFLEVTPGEKVLDLCAAPGGKSTQIGVALCGKGILVSNEIHPARAKILSENVERLGIRNAIVTNETPEKLAQVFEGYFDKILVDAPCSGEGMFRKNEEALEEWSPDNVKLCGERQDEILEHAATMLKPGGRMVYSTCTFAPFENEGSMGRFLSKHPEFHVCRIDKPEGFSDGDGRWCDEETLPFIRDEMAKTARIWPHKVHGEGHYLAVLKKEGSREESGEVRSLYGLEKGLSRKEVVEYLDFAKESLQCELEGVYLKFGDQLYLGPKDMPALYKLRVLRPGLHLGTIKKNRFEPSHALALALERKEVMYTYDLKVEDGSAKAYLGGQTFSTEGPKGWYLITVNGYSLGWGKLAGGIMKNHYPKGLRKM